MKVVVFGGAFEPQKKFKPDKDINPLAKTDELKFGKLIDVMTMHGFEG